MTILLSMDNTRPSERHEHVATVVHVVQQKAGVPYEVERQVCSECSAVLDEQPVKRTAA
jgi:hypothetical protein